MGESTTKRISFPPGEISALLEGAVVRGERDVYLLGAQAGQQMAMSLSSLEDNAVFQVYQPNSEQTLPGAGEKDEATNWSGDLPTSGDYIIVIGATRGNTSYTLEVTVV